MGVVNIFINNIQIIK